MPSFSATTGGAERTDAPQGRSVGVVQSRSAHFDAPLALACGRTLPQYDLAYETYGELNAARTNAVLVCHALNASHHVAGYYADDPDNVGWWDNMVGPGKPLDTDRFFVIGVNNLGGCFGSTGPCPSIRRRASLGQRFPAGHGGRLGRRAGAPGRPARHRAVGRGDGRQPRRHAGARLGDPLSGAHPPRAGHRCGAEPVRAEHRVQRGRAPGDHHRPGFSRRPFLRARREAAARAARRAHDRPHHVPVRRRRWRRSSAASCATGSSYTFAPSSRSSRTCATRARSSPSTSTPTRTCASPRRSITSIRPRAGGDLARALAPATASFLVVSFTTDWRFSPARSREIVKALLDNRRNVTLRRNRRAARPRRLLLDDPQYHGVVRAYFDRIARESPDANDERASDSATVRPAQFACGRKSSARADYATIAAGSPRRARARPGLR